MPYVSTEHAREHRREYKRAHPEARRAVGRRAQLRRRQRAREFARQFKMVPCADCGIEYDHWIMEFDHIEEKLFTIAELWKSRYNLDTIAAEIAKCEVVCANCHRDRTWKRRIG